MNVAPAISGLGLDWKSPERGMLKAPYCAKKGPNCNFRLFSNNNIFANKAPTISTACVFL